MTHKIIVAALIGKMDIVEVRNLRKKLDGYGIMCAVKQSRTFVEFRVFIEHKTTSIYIFTSAIVGVSLWL